MKRNETHRDNVKAGLAESAAIADSVNDIDTMDAIENAIVAILADMRICDYEAAGALWENVIGLILPIAFPNDSTRYDVVKASSARAIRSALGISKKEWATHTPFTMLQTDKVIGIINSEMAFAVKHDLTTSPKAIEKMTRKELLAFAMSPAGLAMSK